jgi:hypothetical protein
MRKLFLISAFVLASVSAQAGENRGLVLAANDEPQATEKVEAAKPAEAQPGAAKADVKADAAQPEATKPRTVKTQARRHESDEAKARRIAARYGIYW